MKTQNKNISKLGLNKQTVTKLNASQMTEVNGGGTWIVSLIAGSISSLSCHNGFWAGLRD